MSTELHLTIKAETALAALNELAELGVRALQELGGAPQSADTKEPELPLPAPAATSTKDNGAGEPAKGDGATQPEKRTRAKRAPAPELAVDRDAIVKGLTELYMGGDPTLRERITAFRDGYGAQRLRELKDDALPEAQKLLSELRQTVGP